MSLGGDIFSQINLEYPVVIGYFISFVRGLTDIFSVVDPKASAAEQIWSSQIFFIISIILLSVCFLVTVAAHLKLGAAISDSQGVKVRSWDAVLIAVSPIVIFNAFINWDLIVVMFTSLGLLAWARKRPAWAGVCFGLGISTKFYPIIIFFAIAVLCLRAGKLRALAKSALALVGTWILVNLPVMLTAFEGWKYFWTMNLNRGSDLGSIWYVLSLIGFNIPHLTAISFILFAVACLGVAYIALSAPKRPRVAQIALLMLIAFLICNKVYSPQYALWLLPLVVMAKPRFPELCTWTITELIYWFAVWGFLEGILGPGSNAEWLYWFAILIRVCGQLWLALRVIDNIYRPWEDPVREPFIDDPHGGVLDHATDRITFNS